VSRKEEARQPEAADREEEQCGEHGPQRSLHRVEDVAGRNRVDAGGRGEDECEKGGRRDRRGGAQAWAQRRRLRSSSTRPRNTGLPSR
jgi:hypothetical protein